MGKVVKCPAGQWTRLIDNFASGMPAGWTIDFTSQGELGGVARESRSFLPLGLALTSDAEIPLQASMDFQRYWTNASYRLEVRPTQDTEATFR